MIFPSFVQKILSSLQQILSERQGRQSDPH